MGSRTKALDNKNWAVQLEKQYTKTGNHPPGDGWKTFSDIRLEIGCGICRCRRIISSAKQAGEIEVWNGSAVSPTTGTLCRQIWYRPTKKGGI